MSTEEAQRHALYNRLTEVLGPEHSVTMMTFMPAIPADQVLTKDDFKAGLEGLGEKFEAIDARFERMEDRLDHLDQRLHDHIRLFVGTTVGAMTGLTAIYAFVVSLIR